MFYDGDISRGLSFPARTRFAFRTRLAFMTRLAFATTALAAFMLAASVPARAQDSELVMRMDQIESSLRQLTGQVEQLQYRNQQLEEQLRALQDGRGSAAPASSPAPAMPTRPQPGAVAPAPVETPPAAPSGRRSDAFDPNLTPNAPGAPRPLGGGGAPLASGASGGVGIPGGRQPGAPLDLSNMSGGAQVAAVQPPSNTPKDEFDLGYGYMMRRDYALAGQTFRDFLSRFPNDRLTPDAQFWLGESLFQRQNYRDAANAFLDMKKRYDSHPKTPEALLRLGQSLAALSEKELACATFGEVARNYPRAPASVRQTVEREQKRVHC
jgi:tol-pal system protein YbgF